MLIGVALLSALIGYGVASGLGGALALAPPWPLIAGALASLAAFVLILWLTEKTTYVLYLCDAIVSIQRYAIGHRPDWTERMGLFAGYVVDAVRATAAEEVLVVGHSLGSVLAVDVLARALTLDPQLGRHGKRVALLTIGANMPFVGFYPQARWLHDHIRQLAVEPSIDWVDFQSRHDIMNFWPFDPITGHGIVLKDDERRNPQVVAISFRDLWKPGNFGRRRWRFFRAHFQFLFANERLGAAYDYYLICCGPLDLVTRATKPQEAIAAMAAKNGPNRDAATAR
jgi:pimeloyl-ACP methyl ester carboxylesterase